MRCSHRWRWISTTSSGKLGPTTDDRPPHSWLRRSGAATTREASRGWWAHQDLNLEPADYEPAALTIELWAPKELRTENCEPGTELRISFQLLSSKFSVPSSQFQR